MVLESLQHLDEVLCAEVYDALVTTAKLGISAIPGGITESLGAQVGIKAAKMIFKHGLGSDTFRIWYNGFCPLGKIGNDGKYTLSTIDYCAFLVVFCKGLGLSEAISKRWIHGLVRATDRPNPLHFAFRGVYDVGTNLFSLSC
jgi:hypothetical protein